MKTFSACTRPQHVVYVVSGRRENFPRILTISVAAVVSFRFVSSNSSEKPFLPQETKPCVYVYVYVRVCGRHFVIRA